MFNIYDLAISSSFYCCNIVVVMKLQRSVLSFSLMEPRDNLFFYYYYLL